MKKFFLSLSIFTLILILGVLFLLPYGLGWIAQNKYTQILDTFAKSNTLQLALVDYQRGWFSSEATIKITLPNQPDFETLLVQQHIEHGPVFSCPKDQQKKCLMLGQTLITSHVNTAVGMIHMVSWIDLKGAFLGTLRMPDLSYTAEKKNNTYSARLANITGDFQLSPDLKKITVQLHVPKAVIKLAGFEQQVAQMNISYHLKKSESGLFLGQRRLYVHEMALNFPIHPFKLKLNGLEAKASSNEQNHQLRDEFNIALQQVVLHNAVYGPEQIVFTVNQIDIPSFLALRKEINSWKNKIELSEADIANYQQLLMDLLNRGLQMQLKQLALVTPWGSPKLAGSVTFPTQSTNDALTLFSAANVTLEAQTPATFLIRLLEKTNGLVQRWAAAEDNAPTATPIANKPPALTPIQMAQQQITEWVNKKWLLPKDNGYQIQLTRQNQQMTINGELWR